MRLWKGGEGRSVRAIARQMEVSHPTVLRVIQDEVKG